MPTTRKSRGEAPKLRHRLAEIPRCGVRAGREMERVAKADSQDHLGRKGPRVGSP